MDIFCDKCQKVVGKVSEDKIPIGKKASVTCPGCNEKIFLTREDPQSNPDFENTILMPSGSDPEKPQYEAESFAGPSDAGPTDPGPIDTAIPDDEYDFDIMDVIKEAWQKTSGAKGPLWGAGFLVFLIVMGFSIVMGLMMGLLGAGPESVAVSGAMQLAVTVAMYPFLAGIMMIGIRRSVDQPITYKMAFRYFSFVVPLVISALLVTILTTIGYLLLIIPGIYLSVAYMLVIPLIVEKGMGPWEAMEASRKAIHKKWFKVFGLYIVMGFIYIISIIPLGLGLIWTMPMFIVMSGVLYREIFGVDENS